MSEINVALIQSSILWEKPKENLEHFTSIIDQIEDADLIVLPEMFTTGFSMNVHTLAEAMNGPSVQWMKQMSQQKSAVVCGSLIIKENSHFYNRLLWVLPSGEIEYYDKRHLFSLAKEDQHYKAGKSRKIVELNGFKICLNICYDLRFPVWSRNSQDYDCLLYVANWPDTRSHHWRTLLLARAIENQCYILAVNRVGKDEKGLMYQGDSGIISPSGEWVGHIEKVEAVMEATIGLSVVKNYRNKFNFLSDRDNFEILT